jgi:hypothetical protein
MKAAAVFYTEDICPVKKLEVNFRVKRSEASCALSASLIHAGYNSANKIFFFLKEL